MVLAGLKMISYLKDLFYNLNCLDPGEDITKVIFNIHKVNQHFLLNLNNLVYYLKHFPIELS